MIFSSWILFFLAIQVIHFFGTWRLYKAAGYKGWHAAVPLYNGFILMKIIKRPFWWVLLLFVPTVNLIVFGAIWIETLRSFGKNTIKDTFLGLASFGLYIYTINYSNKPIHIPNRDLRSKTGIGETLSSILFAIVAATIVHNYVIQPYIIPTGSLEKSLLIGDFLFVSKFHFGARLPMTAVSVPMVHDTVPFLKIRSYLKNPQLPYLRLPALQKIKRNDIVVFSWPADTVRQFFVREKRVDKPIDKKSNYVKRCVGVSGDTLEIKNGIIYINNSKNKLPEWAKIQHTYTFYNKDGISSRTLLKNNIKDFEREYLIKNITQSSFNSLIPYIINRKGNIENFSVTTYAKGLPLKLVRNLGLDIAELKTKTKIVNSTHNNIIKYQNSEKYDSIVRNISKSKTPNESFFPNRITFDWNEDNFGPIIIPKRNITVELSKNNLPIYKKIIREYEKNELTLDLNGTIRINNIETNSYTFKQDYYWMMGDNRYRSEDSRSWGFVPEDHIVGKPVFIWFSIDGINDGFKNWKIRWDRVFTTINLDGEPKSYRWYFLIGVLGVLIFSEIKKRRK